MLIHRIQRKSRGDTSQSLLPPVSGSVSDSKTEEGECDFVVTEHLVVSESEE